MLWQAYPKMGRANRGKSKFADQIEKYLTDRGKDTQEWNQALSQLAQDIQRYSKYINQTGELQPDPWRWMRDKGYEDTYEFQNREGKQNGKPDIADQARDLLDELGES